LHDAVNANESDAIPDTFVTAYQCTPLPPRYGVLQRLILDASKVASLIAGLDDVLRMPDPLGSVTLARELAPGLVLRRVTCPIGVLCIIFEARPEAVVQIASLAIKSGNAVILKGGKEAAASNAALVAAIRGALEATAAQSSQPENLPVDAVQLVSTREEIADLLKLDEYIDVRWHRLRSRQGVRGWSVSGGRMTLFLPAVMSHTPTPSGRSWSSRAGPTSSCVTSRRPHAFPCLGTRMVSAQCTWRPRRTRPSRRASSSTPRRSTRRLATPPRRCWFNAARWKRCVILVAVLASRRPRGGK
jgi:hypothetical protein